MSRIVVLVKPDGVRRGLRSAVLIAYQTQGFKLLKERVCGLPNLEARLERHYAEHFGKDFYPGLINAMCESPVVALLLAAEGPADETIEAGRRLCKQLRSCFALANPNNTVHASDSAEAAAREEKIWFPAEWIPSDPPS